MASRGSSSPRYRWWHAALVGVTTSEIGALPSRFDGDERYYDLLDTPPGAPPGPAFPPIWAFNNVTTLIGDLRVANLPRETEGRRAVLAAEAANWTLFTAFNFVFFGLRSPILGAVTAVSEFAVTAYSVRATARLDRRAAWALTPRLLWLAFASYVSTATALRNRDDLLGYRPSRSIGG
jgi:tryptophan-rich sensory protein